MINETVTYSIVKENQEGASRSKIYAKGKILDKIEMKESGNNVTTTGYLILAEEDNKIYPIAYWRLSSLG